LQRGFQVDIVAAVDGHFHLRYRLIIFKHMLAA
jgi:hypothetical protein